MLRSALGWSLFFIGISVALLGFGDAGTALFSQRTAAVSQPGSKFATPDGFVARLQIPRLGSSLYVVNANRPRDFRRGPGMILGSAEPGEHGNCIIAGHRDLHFRVLKDIKVGDEIQIETNQGRFQYRVASMDIVGAQDSEALSAGYSGQLTLVTCYPFYYIGPAPKRFIVKAYLQGQS